MSGLWSVISGLGVGLGVGRVVRGPGSELRGLLFDLGPVGGLGCPGVLACGQGPGLSGGGLETAVWVIKSGSVWLLEVWGLGLGSGVWCLLGLTRGGLGS